jgi:hypothetical protein
MRNLLLILCVISSLGVLAQDKLLLMNGRIIDVKNVSPSGYIIAYRTTAKNKLKKIDTDRVFSIQYADGSEKVVFTPNPQDSLEYTVPQMRMYIKGEQDASLYYKNTLNKAASFAIGGGAALLAIYGIIIPPIYSTVVGAFSPNMEKMKVSDPALLNDQDYREGYKTKVRNRKIRNSLISGFIGFAVGVVTYSVISQN